ncbi:MAG TPA: hypothetical protein VGE01_10300 [Fimbriimonas sp.]
MKMEPETTTPHASPLRFAGVLFLMLFFAFLVLCFSAPSSQFIYVDF